MPVCNHADASTRPIAAVGVELLRQSVQARQRQSRVVKCSLYGERLGSLLSNGDEVCIDLSAFDAHST